MIHRLSLFVCTVFLPFLFSHAQSTKDLFLEQMINNRIQAYPFSPSNLFRLAVYTELKGKYNDVGEELRLSFGSYATISFYPTHCLLKKGSSAFHLTQGASKSSMSAAMDKVLDEIFEQIMLMSNGNKLPQQIAFVDKWLCQKNIEPFHKIFSRYLLLTFGKFDSKTMQYTFHSKDIPESYTHLGISGGKKTKRKNYALKLVLDTVALRGYYLQTGGSVFVNDVKRDVMYATGEDFHYNNVTAYKLFIQQLFTSSIHHIADFSSSKNHMSEVSFLNKASNSQASSSKGPYELGKNIVDLLKAEDISITDPTILEHLLYRPFFPEIYKNLDKKEQQFVDQYRQNFSRNSSKK